MQNKYVFESAVETSQKLRCDGRFWETNRKFKGKPLVLLFFVTEKIEEKIFWLGSAGIDELRSTRTSFSQKNEPAFAFNYMRVGFNPLVPDRT